MKSTKVRYISNNYELFIDDAGNLVADFEEYAVYAQLIGNETADVVLSVARRIVGAYHSEPPDFLVGHLSRQADELADSMASKLAFVGLLD